MVKDRSRITFLVMLDMAPCAFLMENCLPYQLAAGISHQAVPETINIIIYCSSGHSTDGFE
jgi:hypothetical protein